MTESLNSFAPSTIAAAGTGGTFFFNEANPMLGFICGMLTLTHILIALYKQNKNPTKKDDNKSS
jgi:hypothetical protein